MSDPFVPLDLSATYNAGTGNVESKDGKLWPAPDDAPDNTPLVGCLGASTSFGACPLAWQPQVRTGPWCWWRKKPGMG